MAYTPDPHGRPATRADVARMAGVSVTVVSYVLNNNRCVAEDKRRRVLEAAEALRYHPNRFARGLRGKTTNQIAFIADQIANEHFGQLVQYMDDFAHDKGYLISLYTDRGGALSMEQFVAQGFDGAVISSINFSQQHIGELVAAGIHPVVLDQRQFDALPPEAGRIDIGLYSGAVQAMRHLFSLGKTRVAYIDRCSRHGNFSTLSDLRYRGYVDEMNRHALLPRAVTGCASEGEAVAAIRACAHDVDAFFARNDQLAALALGALREEGRRVPEDCAVVGFDNSQLSQYISPSLTTVEIDRPAVAKAAMTMMDAMLHGQQAQSIRVDTRLIVRQSTGGALSAVRL